MRQRRERAWHARILICTCVISNIDSTLADFKDEILKEEAAALQIYLQQAISKFAAHDSSPTPSPIPSKFQQKKQSGIHNIDLPSKPIAATVTRNGQKKARVINDSTTKSAQAKNANHIDHLNEPKVTNISSRRQLRKGKPISPIKADKRIFLRLPHEHEWRNLSPAGTREIIVKKLAISPASIGRIKLVHTGFALSPCNDNARKKILEGQHGLFMTGAKLEPATNWVSVIVPTVPAYIRTLQGKVEVSNTMLADEIERVSLERPSFLKLYGQNNPVTPHRTWMAFFPKAPRPGFRVFDESGQQCLTKRKNP
ncbi:putative eka-like protein [Erysiphe necator]|uniref:Putative eka-like protein n=1 Tax=Uncinula necator TaxID=52586 RepID=A0A0B1NWT9_UNCNE|nr:putative eka-like protein [Erysiphe necator]